MKDSSGLGVCGLGTAGLVNITLAASDNSIWLCGCKAEVMIEQ